jgi:hypothetical protein
MVDRLLKDVSDWRRLAERLSRVPQVSSLDSDNEKEAETLTHAFADLEASFRVFLDEQLPRLLAREAKAEDINDILIEIGEEFRHILYHIRDPKYYRYLDPSGQ